MKILYVTTISKTLNTFLIPHIKMLVESGHSVDLACNIQQPIDSKLEKIVGNIYQIPFQRSPLNVDNYKGYIELKKIIKNEKYDLVHTHTPVASMIVRLVCKNDKSIRVFYTAHGFHFFKGAPIINWLLYYPIEKYFSRFTDTIITINNEDFNRANKNMKSKRVAYIPGIGLNLSQFKKSDISRSEKRSEISISNDAFIILSVGELNTNKNHSTIIKALSRLGDPSIHYVICGEGPLRCDLVKLAHKLNLDSNVHLLGQRNDILDLCKASDIFAFPSLREGLGMAAIEAMSCGLPIITSNIHGIVDYSVDGETGFLHSPKDIQGFATSIKELKESPKLIENIRSNNLEKAKKYELSSVLPILFDLYK